MAPRAAGVLLHPTSLPGPAAIGDLGPGAYRFVDLLADVGATRWQILPLGPTGFGGSPYDAESSFAGNDLLISAELLERDGLLSPGARPPAIVTSPFAADFIIARAATNQVLRVAHGHLAGSQRTAVDAYRATHASWLEDFALYRAIKHEQGGQPWTEWPQELRLREPAALDDARARLAGDIDRECFAQWCFDEQWTALREYANSRGILVVGDIPIFPSRDSADVWAHQHLFKLDAEGHPLVVTGVPPDYFSETGQLWGNPHYDWPRHHADGYQWWAARFRETFRRVDIVRIDHFRAFAAAWEVPAGDPDARGGAWVAGPGITIFEQLSLAGSSAIIAEDLGTITDDVRELLDASGFPGMTVLQFAFGSGPDNPYLPHNHAGNTVVYTGTHDNNTTAGWLQDLDSTTRVHVADYLGARTADLLDALIRAALGSVAGTAIIPLQDILELDGEARMNTPSEARGNWGWRFAWDMVDPVRFAWFARQLELYGRARHIG